MKHILTQDRFLLNCDYIEGYAIRVLGDDQTIVGFSDPTRTHSTLLLSSKDAQVVDEVYENIINFMDTDERLLSIPRLIFQ